MLTPPKISYPAIESLEIQTNQQQLQSNLSLPIMTTDHLNKTSLPFKQSYSKGQFLYCLKTVLLPTKPPNIEADKISAKYFTFSLNPIYEKISKLPHQVFVCGYCKEIFHGPSQYLLHCLEEECPLNHNRSTHFFYFKNQFSQIQNIDILKTLGENQLKIFKQVSFRKKALLFSSYECRPLKQNIQTVLFCGKCNSEFYSQKRMQKVRFINHCVLRCRSTKTPSNSHSLTVVYLEQDLVDFVEDILNLFINFNTISLFNDSYIRLETNPKFCNSSSLSHFCANCKLSFSKVSQFIQHCLFQCNSKPNPRSSHLIKRKVNKLIKNQTEQDNKKVGELEIAKTSKIQRQKKQKLQKQKTSGNDFPHNSLENNSEIPQVQNQNWETILNPQFADIKDLFQNVYFCGNCSIHFENQKNYLIHCSVYLCPLNQPRNSHFFFLKQSAQILTSSNIQKTFGRKKILQILHNLKQTPQLQKFIKEHTILTNNSTNQVLKTGKKSDYYCGKCQQVFKRQWIFIIHVIRSCFSMDHQNNSHTIQIENEKPITDEEFKQFLMSYLYAVHIIRLNPNKKYRMVKNESIDVDPDYLCGKCDTLFGNKYEYILHLIQVCGSSRCRYSSHFIHLLSIRSAQEIESPLDVIALNKNQQNTQCRRQKQQFNLPQYENQKPKPMEIEVVNSEPKQQFLIEKEKIQFVPIEKEIQNEGINDSKTEEDVIVSQVSSHKKKGDPLRFLRPNIDFIPNLKIRFYCGQCQVSFKKQRDFIDHLKECRNFQSLNSSHFFISNSHYDKAYANKVLLRSNYGCMPGSFPQFKREAQQTFICGCGQFGLLHRFVMHLKNAHSNNVPQGSSHVIFRIIFHRSNLQCLNIPLAINMKNVDPNYEFICPCKPWKKYSYEHFVNHIIKRHERKSPKCYMRLNSPQ